MYKRQDYARVCQRYVRLEAARSTPGHGLGLSLASSVALAHGGQMTLGDAKPGLLATLILRNVSAP